MIGLWLYFPCGFVAVAIEGSDAAFGLWFCIGTVAVIAYAIWGARCPRCGKNLFGRLLAKPYNDELKKKFDCPRCALDVGALEKPPADDTSEHESGETDGG